MSFRAAKVVTYPDVAICGGMIADPTRVDMSGLPNLYNSVKGKLKNLYKELRYKRLSKTANLRNVTELELLGYKEEDVWSDYLGYTRGFLNYCLNFHPPVNSTMGTDGDVSSDVTPLGPSLTFFRSWTLLPI